MSRYALLASAFLATSVMAGVATTSSSSTTTSALPVPTICGVAGFDLNKPNAYLSDSTGAYNTFDSCKSYCGSTVVSFAFGGTTCLCYAGPAGSNILVAPNSDFVYYDADCASPVVTTTSSSSSSSTTTEYTTSSTTETTSEYTTTSTTEYYEGEYTTTSSWDPTWTTSSWEPKWTTSSTESEDEWNTWSKTTTPAYNEWNTWTTTSADPTWESWSEVTPAPTKHGKPHHGKGKGEDDDDEEYWVTMTEEWEYPCETGWATSTTTITTKWCGCKETPKPEHPEYTTYTTECPETWGVGKTVTVTVPYVTSTWADAEATWSAWSEEADPSSTWVEWSSAKPTSTETWATWSEVMKTSSTTSSKWADATSSATWATWTSPAAVSTGTWATWSSPAASSTGAWSAVKEYKGAATSTGVNAMFVMAAGAVAGFAFLL